MHFGNIVRWLAAKEKKKKAQTKEETLLCRFGKSAAYQKKKADQDPLCLLTTPTLWPPRHAQSTARSRWSSHARRMDCVPVCVSEPMPMALCRRPRPRGSIGGGPNTEAGEQRAGYATADPTAPRHCHGGVVSKIRLHHAASHRKPIYVHLGKALVPGCRGHGTGAYLLVGGLEPTQRARPMQTAQLPPARAHRRR